MTPTELFDQAVVGDVVQIIWTSALFDPEAIIRPGQQAPVLNRTFSCGFVADIGINREYIALGIDALYENGSTDPSFRTTLTIPTSAISSAEIYGRIL